MKFSLNSENSVLTPHEKKQRVLIGVLLLVLLAIAAVWYFGLRVPKVDIPEDVLPSGGANSTPKHNSERIIREIEFDTEFLKDPNFRKLQEHGQWPLEIGETGRDNPFLPQ